VLTFISKCAAVPEPDFETLVHEHDLSLVIYNTALPPLLAAAADATPKEQDYGPRRYVGGWVDLEMVVVLGVGVGVGCGCECGCVSGCGCGLGLNVGVSVSVNVVVSCGCGCECDCEREMGLNVGVGVSVGFDVK